MSETLAINGGTPVRTRPFGPSHHFGDEDIAAITEVIQSGSIGRGAQVDQFEQAWAARHGVKHAVTVNSGTSAMHVCVAAINPDPGDEIIVTPWTSGGSIIGMLLHNAVPIFADIDDTYNMDPNDVENKITSRTRAIMAVHIFGNPCDMAALQDIAKRHDLFLIEDCAQSHLAEYQGRVIGNFGDISGFSFGGKHLSAGQGGAVLTDNEVLWERALLFRDAALPRGDGPYAGRPYANYFLAPNYKITDVTAAILRTQLNKVEGYIATKIRAAQQLIDALADIKEITPQRVRPGDRHTYWMQGFTLDTERLGCSAWDFAEAVKAEGISLLFGPYLGTGREGPLYRNPFLAEPNCYGSSRFPFDYGRERPVDYKRAVCPYGEALMSRGINLSMRLFSKEDVDDSARAIRKVATHYL